MHRWRSVWKRVHQAVCGAWQKESGFPCIFPIEATITPVVCYLQIRECGIAKGQESVAILFVYVKSACLELQLLFISLLVSISRASIHNSLVSFSFVCDRKTDWLSPDEF